MTENAPVSAKTTTRRSVLRVGANAAWAVPAVSLATAVPAFAAASTDARIVSAGASLNRLGNIFTGQLIIANTGKKASGQITVVFSNIRVQKKPGDPFTPISTGKANFIVVSLAPIFAGVVLDSSSATVSSIGIGLSPGSNATISFTITPGLAGLLGAPVNGVQLDYVASVAAPGVSTAAGTITA